MIPENSYIETIYTEDIKDHVEKTLRKISKPYPRDITDQVFLTIENGEKLLHYYKVYAGENIGAANKYIGKMVRLLSGLRDIRPCRSPKSSLIKSYTLLG